MPCKTVDLGNGSFAIVKMARTPAKRCKFCGSPARFLCDFKLAGGKTCDKPLCGLCRTPQGPDVDWCKDHVGIPKP